MMSPRLAQGYAVLIVVTLSLSGCVGSPTQDEPAKAQAGGITPRPTVVAIVDTGVNPYHDVFRASAGEGVDSLLGSLPGVQLAHLSTNGSYEERMKTDRQFWESVENETLYAFSGTHLLATSFGHGPSEVPLQDGVGHGTSVLHAILQQDPNAILVSVEVDTALCDSDEAPSRCPHAASFARALRWVADQPWIDVVSLSLVNPGNLPSNPVLDAEALDYVAATRLLQERGKIVVTAAGNVPMPSLATHYSGPPWTIAVGGFEYAQQGESSDSSKAIDVVANYTVYLADAETTDGWEWQIGTSFAAPTVAGTLSKAVYLVREAQGQHESIGLEDRFAAGLDTKAFRDALNASALTVPPTAWDPTAAPTNRSILNLLTQSVPILVPGAQAGWGYVDGSLAPEIARRVLENDLAPPPEKAETARYMAQWQSLREQYWANAP